MCCGGSNDGGTIGDNESTKRRGQTSCSFKTGANRESEGLFLIEGYREIRCPLTPFGVKVLFTCERSIAIPTRGARSWMAENADFP
ncbi:MAG: hypothetical protein Ct9H300mP8_03050 [Gammaproteobacteria bacterium]|nr:MAG: hypothetical protein Ct9H300mP8_03050 [Gammaproteobacteria bacterium]